MLRDLEQAPEDGGGLVLHEDERAVGFALGDLLEEAQVRDGRVEEARGVGGEGGGREGAGRVAEGVDFWGLGGWGRGGGARRGGGGVRDVGWGALFEDRRGESFVGGGCRGGGGG